MQSRAACALLAAVFLVGPLMFAHTVRADGAGHPAASPSEPECRGVLDAPPPDGTAEACSQEQQPRQSVPGLRPDARGLPAPGLPAPDAGTGPDTL